MTLSKESTKTDADGNATVQVVLPPLQSGSVILKARTKSGHEMEFDLSNGSEDLAMWLNAGSLPLSDGNVVSTWSDVAPQATLDITQSTPSLQPVYRTVGINGKPSVYFDGTDMLSRSSLDFGVSSVSIFVVYNAEGKAGAMSEARIVNNGHSGWNRGYFVGTGTSEGLFGGVGGADQAGSTLINDNDVSVATVFGSGPTIAAMIWDADADTLTLWSQGKKLRISKLGTSGGTLNTDTNELSTAGLGTLSTTNYWTGRGFRLGAEISGFAHLVGHISEVVIYNKALNSAQTEKFFEYFSEKYAIALVD